MFQLSVILYDGLAGQADHASIRHTFGCPWLCMVTNLPVFFPSPEKNQTSQTKFKEASGANISIHQGFISVHFLYLQKRGMEYMIQVATCTAKKAKHLVRAAQYNVGRAYYQGFGIRQSDENAEKWAEIMCLPCSCLSMPSPCTSFHFHFRYWLLAADDGNPKASIKAQSALGMFYSRPDTLDLKKAFFWHSEACGNGSLESQGMHVLTRSAITQCIMWLLLQDGSFKPRILARKLLLSLYQPKFWTKFHEQ